VKLFDFFPRRILICLTLDLSRFFPKSVEILTWNFNKKIFQETFSEILFKPRLSSTKICDFSPNFLQFYFASILRWKNSHKYFHMLFSLSLGGTSINEITKMRYREENPRCFVFGKSVLFTLDLGLTTPYCLGLLVWNFFQTLVIVCVEFRLRFEPQTRSTRFAINFLFITVRAERKVRLCVTLLDFFFLGEYSSVWPNTCHVLSQIQWGFLHVISTKNNFQRNFQKFCANQGYPLPKYLNICPTFCNFILRTALKKFTQILRYVVFTHLRRHVHKLITKMRYREEKLGRFLFRKPVVFTLGLRLTTPYFLRLLVSNF